MTAVTAREAAAVLFGVVDERTIEQWVARGLVPSYGGLLDLDDVLDVEARTRRRPRVARLLEMAGQQGAPGA
jgi:hypothetical protein